MVFAPVADVFSRVTSEMTVVRLQTEDGVRTLRLTPEHPAYVDTMGWVQARMLAPGDAILDYDDNTPLTVISVEHEETTERVYNFEVEGTHNYFAGDVGAWVHNGKFRDIVGGGIAVLLSVFTDADENPFENRFKPEPTRFEQVLDTCGGGKGKRREGALRNRLNSSTSPAALLSGQ